MFEIKPETGTNIMFIKNNISKNCKISFGWNKNSDCYDISVNVKLIVFLNDCNIILSFDVWSSAG